MMIRSSLHTVAMDGHTQEAFPSRTSLLNLQVMDELKDGEGGCCILVGEW